MTTLVWIVVGALAKSAIAWVGLFSLALKQEQLQRILLPLVAFSAGSLRRCDRGGTRADPDVVILPGQSCGDVAHVLRDVIDVEARALRRPRQRGFEGKRCQTSRSELFANPQILPAVRVDAVAHDDDRARALSIFSSRATVLIDPSPLRRDDCQQIRVDLGSAESGFV
jgi:hypothetical protein